MDPATATAPEALVDAAGTIPPEAGAAAIGWVAGELWKLAHPKGHRRRPWAWAVAVGVGTVAAMALPLLPPAMAAGAGALAVGVVAPLLHRLSRMGRSKPKAGG